MKTLDVNIKQINRLAGRRESCLYDILKTIAAFYNSSLDNIYINEFGFDFDYAQYEKTGLIGESLKQKPDPALTNMENFYGLKLEKCYFEKFEQELDYIKASLEEKSPAIIHFDSYKLPWDPFYNKIHNNHILLITGMDSKSFCIVDPYFNKTNEILSIETVKNASEFFMYFIKNEAFGKIPSFNDLLKTYYGNIKLHPSSSYINLEYFSQAFLTSFDTEKEFTDVYLDQNVIFKNLSDCVLRGDLFYELIEYQHSLNQNQSLLSMKEELINIINAWNNVISLTALKHFKETGNKKISDFISELSFRYENVFNLIEKYLKGIDG